VTGRALKHVTLCYVTQTGRATTATSSGATRQEAREALGDFDVFTRRVFVNLVTVTSPTDGFTLIARRQSPPQTRLRHTATCCRRQETQTQKESQEEPERCSQGCLFSFSVCDLGNG